MQIYEINPYVRFFQRMFSGIPYPSLVYAYDFRLFYVRHGSVLVETEEETFSVANGGLIVLPPAFGYRLIFDGTAVEYIVINFDFVMTAYDCPPSPPVSRNQFQRGNVYSVACPSVFSKPFHAEYCAMLDPVFYELERAMKEKTPASGAVASAEMKHLLGSVMDDASINPEKIVSDGTITRVETYILENLSRKITIAEIAEAMGYHPNYLNTRFLALSGQTIHAYIESQRIERAKGLLASTSLPVAQVAEECGFPEPSYFVKFFVRHEGITPKKYRKLVM